MFTGLIEGVARVLDARRLADAMELRVDLGPLNAGVRVGDSIALSGVCCTATHVLDGSVRFWLSAETLNRTWLGQLMSTPIALKRKLNVERCLRAGQPMGGHIVQGHVDGVGKVTQAVAAEGGTWRVEVPQALVHYCVEKGSIALDGVSLTIAELAGTSLSVAVIPHTATHTTLGALAAGDPVNVEVDVLAKYVERLLTARIELRGDPQGVGLNG
jgi:riboflavin synthase